MKKIVDNFVTHLLIVTLGVKAVELSLIKSSGQASVRKSDIKTRGFYPGNYR